MNDQENKNAKIKPVAYYGKKTYVIHPMLARLKLPDHKKMDFSDQNIAEKKAKQT